VSYRFLWFRPYEALVLWSPPLALALSWGQNGVLMAALYIAAFRWLNTRTVLSGIFFGLCAVKPQLGVLVPFLLLAGRHLPGVCFGVHHLAGAGGVIASALWHWNMGGVCAYAHGRCAGDAERHRLYAPVCRHHHLQPVLD